MYIALCIVALMLVLMVQWAMRFQPEQFWAAVAKEPRSAWDQHLKWLRSDFMHALRMRDEAYLAFDGEGLEYADEWLRADLDALGGLAKAW
ncbi:hypothetical protein HI806_10380 [Ralstonia solanacearum]|uniref:Putative minor coat protein n=1 Tax=Ralstonia phage PE226 TaxID=926543 RepID=E5F069_9VIRU|nr:hypothetical protein [Ralstonia pseudosolanacearum]YP_004327581.1 putative minor coat protein [Ralstonia phage PE226]AOE93134.1 hypothetical protein LBM341_04890 [Ralstonia solanacearum]APF87116.1 hypothetical protein BCR16_10025 [Ralstonia solanacearum FJAT-1458]ARS57944.1 hypothetical protein BC427_08355 [Ralstonia solanacearum FJAT-91]ESS50651.1 putative minor coat protein [Ralstonia solanacearum SD54]ADQ27587.1 putative minor coat protein [Ralstonia phage PE226]